MKIIYNSFIPFGKHYAAINLFGILFVKHGIVASETLLNHEKIHTAQIRELLYLGFYILYVTEWLLRLIQYRGNNYRAYRAISFEHEAYQHQTSPNYLNQRMPFAQWR